MKTYLVKHGNGMIEELPTGSIPLTREEVEDWYYQHASNYNGNDPCSLQVGEALDELFGKGDGK